MSAHSSSSTSAQTTNSQKRRQSAGSALESGPRKKLTTQDPLVHHGRHFGRAMHAFCNVATLLTNSIILLSDCAEDDLESMSAIERQEFAIFWELLRTVPGLEVRLMESSEEEVMLIGELVQKGTNGARADDTKGMKSAIIDWITPKGQSLNPHIPRNVKSGRDFNHKRTGALLCPAGLDWANNETKLKLVNGQIQVAGDQWPVFLYANYTYDTEDPWNGLLRSGLLVSAFKHISLPQARSIRNQRQPGLATHESMVCAELPRPPLPMWQLSILQLLDDPDEKDEVDQLLTWWNRQVFPLCSDAEHLPSKDSALAMIRQKRAEYKERASIAS
ncbi:hypothetical protein PAXINDRAFT_20832 [Paxillus involutus ATCC 200175]|uniref:Uncharacterized protein n=1 Tax=Paxillus involutus ATCC 200175 TaxID=664439 RepID=A0A0C9SMC7_PAXIN|nr:hypothetical protein PAXINDRAFT_20832 [Paxillus involutus ATCC 200175]